MRRRLQRLGKKKFVRDTVVMQLSTVVQAGTYLATSVFIARHLGPLNFGRWNVSREIFSMTFLLVSSGLLSATLSRYSAAVGAQNRDAAVASLAALAKASFGCSLAVLVLGVALAPWIGRRFYGDVEVGLMAAALCATGFFESIKGLAAAALQGARQMAAYARLDMTASLLRVAVVAGVVFAGLGIRGVMWAFLAHAVLLGVLSLRAYSRARRDFEPKLRPPPLRDVLAAVPRASLRELFRVSYFLSIFKVMNTVVPRLGLVLIPVVGVTLEGSFDQGGAYGVAYVLSWGLQLLASAVPQTLLPALGLKMGSSDVPFEKMGRSLLRVTLVSGGLILGLVLLSLPLMPWVISTFYGEAYAGAFPFFCWLSVGTVLIGFAVVVEPFYIYADRLAAALRRNVVYSVLSVGMIVSGAALFGPMGVAVATGTCRAFVVFHLVYIGRYFRRARARASRDGTPSGRP